MSTQNFGDPEQRQHDPKPHEHMADAEAKIGRNPHPDFQTVEAARPDWNAAAAGFRLTKTKDPDWRPGQGGNDGGASLRQAHVEIDPYAAGRPSAFNYKLLISAIVPRPVGFLSTRAADGTSTNLAPFSYTQVVNHDPPIFTVGFAGGLAHAKDSLRNLLDSGECCINIVSEHFAEALNFTSINAPYGTSEWALTGLHPAACTTVRCSRVQESVFSVEAKLMETKEFESRATKGAKTGVLAIVEGTRFWVREDAINEERNLVDMAVLRPIARLGGITYGRVTEGFELPRPEFAKVEGEVREGGLVRGKVEGQ